MLVERLGRSNLSVLKDKQMFIAEGLKCIRMSLERKQDLHDFVAVKRGIKIMGVIGSDNG